MKTWKAIVEVNSDASHWETITVRANTELKARAFVKKKAKKMGFFSILFVSIKEIDTNENTN